MQRKKRLSPGGASAVLSLALILAAWRPAGADFDFPSVKKALATPAASDSITPVPVPRLLYVNEDATDVLKEPREGAESEELRLTQLMKGETVTLLAETQDWYQVEVPRREYDAKTGGWKNTQGWVRRMHNIAIQGSGPARVNPGAVPPPAPSFTTDASIARKPVVLKPLDCRGAFVSAMKGYLDVPYLWGGTSHRGVDCSGLVQSAMIEAGCVPEAPPRTAADQFRAAKPLEGPEDLKEGDLIFLGPGEPGSKPDIKHVIGFIGDGMVIEAPKTGDVVKISELERRLKKAGKWRVYYGSLLPN